MRVVITGGTGFLGSHLCRAFLVADDCVDLIDNFSTGRTSNIEELFVFPRFKFRQEDVCRPFQITVMEVAKMIQELTQSQQPIVSRPLPVNDPKVRRPDIARTRELLGWEPQVTLKKGLEQTRAYSQQDMAVCAQGKEGSV